jgi:hypothetical protein
MKTEQEYIKDLNEIRSMMERSAKFLSLTGWSGIMAGIYALAGTYLAWKLFYVYPDDVLGIQGLPGNGLNLILLALSILVLAIGTAVLLSYRKSQRKGERLWNSAARRLVINMAIPLATGGLLILILILKGLYGLLVPLTLIFYGLALLNASKFTYEEVRYLGIIEILLGLFAAYFIVYGLLFWAVGFGVMHIIYGIYMHLKYES